MGTGHREPAARRPPSGVIDDPRHPAARRVADVLRSRRGTQRTILIDDPDNIRQARWSGIRLESLYATDASLLAELGDLGADGPPAHVITTAVADALFGGDRRPRAFALARAPRVAALDDLSLGGSDLIALDGVRLVGNIGAITRSAAGLGAAGVVLIDSGLRSVFDRRLIRASRGLVFAVPVVLATRDEFADHVRRTRLTVATLSAGASEPLSTIDDAVGGMCLVLGGERRGVSAELAALSDGGYAIPLSPLVESLNVSVAAAIALYERARRSPMHPRGTRFT